MVVIFGFVVLIVVGSLSLLGHIDRGHVAWRREDRVVDFCFRGALESLELGLRLGPHGGHPVGLAALVLPLRRVVEVRLVGGAVGVDFVVEGGLHGRVREGLRGLLLQQSRLLLLHSHFYLYFYI